MKYIQKNKDVVIRIIEDGIEITIPKYEIRVELNPLSTLIYKNIDKFETVLELARFAYSKLVDYGIREEDVLYDDLCSDINTFVFVLLQQGVLFSEKLVNFQPCNFMFLDGKWSVYFPYLRIALYVNESLYSTLKQYSVSNYYDILKCSYPPKEIIGLLKYLNKPIALNEHETYQHIFSRRIVMLPTTVCNLNCSYCYAWRDNKPIHNMSKEIAEAGIQYIAINALNSDTPRIDISFMGGGEPTCNWDIIVHSVNYARNIATENNVPFSVTLTTNGILSDNKIDWIIKNVDNIKISFDGIKEVQDQQRPIKNGSSFEKVSYTMQRLSNACANFLVRITVTNSSISFLEDSVKYIVDNFSPNSIIINPVYICGSCASHGVESIDYNDICKKFAAIQNLGLEKHIDIVIPYDKVTYMETPRMPFCGFQKGNCFLTPEGYLSACSEIDGLDDPRSTIFFFGTWNASKKELRINKEKEQQLRSITMSKNRECSVCSNNNFCPGPCLVRRIDEKTMKQIIKLRGDSPIDSSFTPEELNLLIDSDNSMESKIQCNMTKIISSCQVSRILNETLKLNNLSLSTSELSLEGINVNGILKVISIHTK